MIYVNMILYSWETQGNTQTTLSEFLFLVTDPGLPACSPGQPSSPSTGPTAGLAASWQGGHVARVQGGNVARWPGCKVARLPGGQVSKCLGHPNVVKLV